MKKLSSMIAVFAGFCLIGLNVYSQGGLRPQRQGRSGGLMKACEGDLNSFCTNVEPGPERPQCLREHEAQLSKECRQALDGMRQPQQGGMSPVGKACREDLNKFCKDVAPGPERPKCLKEHAGDLSAECREAVANMRPPQGGRSAIANTCKEDLNSFCKDVEPGPERPKCLQEHENDLSAECREAVGGLRPPKPGNRGPGRGRPGPGRRNKGGIPENSEE